MMLGVLEGLVGGISLIAFRMVGASSWSLAVSWKNDSKLLLLDSSSGRMVGNIGCTSWPESGLFRLRMFLEFSSTPLILVDSKSLSRLSLLLRRSGWPNLKNIFLIHLYWNVLSWKTNEILSPILCNWGSLLCCLLLIYSLVIYSSYARQKNYYHKEHNSNSYVKHSRCWAFLWKRKSLEKQL